MNIHDLITTIVNYCVDNNLSWPAQYDIARRRDHDGLFVVNADSPGTPAIWRQATPDSYGVISEMLYDQHLQSGAPIVESGPVDSIESAAITYSQFSMSDDWYTSEAGNLISAVLMDLPQPEERL